MVIFLSYLKLRVLLCHSAAEFISCFKGISSAALQESLKFFSSFCADPLTDLLQAKIIAVIMLLFHPPSCLTSNKSMYFDSLQATQEAAWPPQTSKLCCFFKLGFSPQITLKVYAAMKLIHNIFGSQCLIHEVLQKF